MNSQKLIKQELIDHNLQVKAIIQVSFDKCQQTFEYFQISIIFWLFNSDQGTLLHILMFLILFPNSFLIILLF